MLQNILFAAAFAVFLWVGTRRGEDCPAARRKAAAPYAILLLLAAGFLFRLVLGAVSTGYSVDVNTFKSWAVLVYETPFREVYGTAAFLDYPPGYLYVLWLAEALRRLLGLEFASAGYTLLIKLPSILADIACAYAVYALARPKGERTACFSAAVWLLCPAVLINSTVWGQADSFCTMLVLFALLCMLHSRYLPAAMLFGMAVLCKPQMLAFTPLFVFWPLRQKHYRQLITGILAAVGTGLLLAAPFTQGFNFLWLIKKYASTMGFYNYFTVNAYNLYGLLGLNWGSMEGLGALSACLTVLFCGAAVVLAGAVILRGKRPDALFAAAALLMATVFLFCPKMHERYLFPTLLFLWVCCVYTRDRRLQFGFGVFATLHFLNVNYVLYLNNRYVSPTSLPVLALSLGHLLAYGWLLFALYRVYIQGEVRTVAPGKRPRKALYRPHPAEAEPLGTTARPGLRDFLLAGAVTLLFAAVSFTGLGSTQMATTVWQGEAGDEVVFQMSGETDSLRYVPGIAANGSGRTITGVEATVSVSADGETWTELGVLSDTTIFSYNQLDVPQAEGTYLKLTATGTVVLNEIAAKAKGEDRLLTLELLSGGGEALTDEQDTVPLYRTPYNSAYFDEIYHARTAYEHILGCEPYENTHPTLGKLILSLGIRLFGMNPFGWRCMGALCGVLMLPVLYHLLWQLFGKTKYALFGTLLFSLDFMHFTQTRIGTIDTYAVLFILLMFDAMAAFVKQDPMQPLQKLLPPLFWAGIFTGLAAASKWTGLYAALGLAVLYFGRLVLAWLRTAPGEREVFLHRALVLCAWCCLFFVVLPFGIYFAAFLPVTLLPQNAGHIWSAFWGYQKHMLAYHSALTATHYFASPWYEWPLLWRPIWYFANSHMTSTGLAGSLSCMGNPLLWWAGAAAMVYAAVDAFRRKTPAACFILIGYLAVFLPWVGITRTTFIYHYFPAVPFLCLAVTYVFRRLEQRPAPRLALGRFSCSAVSLGMGAYVVGMLALFLIFWPIISGAPATLEYINALEWLPQWYFF